VNLTRAEHRILQMFLNLGELTTAQIIEAIGRQIRYPREYLHRLRCKIAPEGLAIDMIRSPEVRYTLRRTRPRRDRAAYMRSYRKSVRAGLAESPVSVSSSWATWGHPDQPTHR
jgi:hypothetical protein